MSRLGPRRAEVATAIAGAARNEERVSAAGGVAALGLLERMAAPVRLISCSIKLPDMEVRSFLRRCAELYPDAYRVLVLERGTGAPPGDLLRRFHAQTVVTGPLTSATVRELLASADESLWIRSENHRLGADLARADAKVKALRNERSRLLRFLAHGMRRVTSIEELRRWWESISRYVDAEFADIPAFPQETRLSALIDEAIAGLSLDSRLRIRNRVSRSQHATVDRVSFRECLRFALHGLVAAAPGAITVHGNAAELTLFHEHWDVSLTELDQLLQPYARLSGAALTSALDLPLARVLARTQGLGIDARPGPYCRGVRLVLELVAREQQAACGSIEALEALP